MKKTLIGILAILIPVALIIGTLALSSPVATNPPAPAPIQNNPSNSPNSTPDAQPVQKEAMPNFPVFVVPEYPLLGGVVAMLACFVALAVYKVAKKRE
jgi:hypothetical protein